MANYNNVEQMMDSFDILADIPFTMMKVKKLQQIATNLEGVNKILNNQLKKIDETWKGNSAEAMKDKLTQAKSTNEMLIDDLNQVASKIKTICENIYNEDMASVQRIESMGK